MVVSVASSDHSTDKMGNPTLSDHAPTVLHSNESPLPNAVADEDKLDWKSTAVATAKLLLRGVRDSTDAFGPLKSVAGGLCFVLDNCEVRISLPRVLPNAYNHSSERRQIRKRLKRWHPGSRRLLGYSVDLFPRVISMRDQEERSWNGKPVLSSIESLV